MSGNESRPSDDVNWEAYSHEELHRMLWQDADVADVSTVADEWTRHRTALSTHAEVLREQRTALLGDWHGPAAEEAAARLGALADRIEKISELASAGQRAAQDAADALATARAAMPPPPAASPFELPTTPAFASLPTAPAFTSLPTAPAAFNPAAFNPATFTPATFNPGAGGTGFSFYFGVASADQQKAQAVRTMQSYESSLNGGSRLIDDARGAVPQAAPPSARPAATAGPGVPWQRLVGGGAAAASRGMSPVIGAPVGSPANTPAQLTPGGRAGVVFGLTGGSAVVTGPFGADPSTRNAAQNGAMAPPGGGARGEDDQRHENQMPTLDHGLFELDERACPPVIGETSGVES